MEGLAVKTRQDRQHLADHGARRRGDASSAMIGHLSALTLFTVSALVAVPPILLLRAGHDDGPRTFRERRPCGKIPARYDEERIHG